MSRSTTGAGPGAPGCALCPLDEFSEGSHPTSARTHPPRSACGPGNYSTAFANATATGHARSTGRAGDPRPDARAMVTVSRSPARVPVLLVGAPRRTAAVGCARDGFHLPLAEAHVPPAGPRPPHAWPAVGFSKPSVPVVAGPRRARGARRARRSRGGATCNWRSGAPQLRQERAQLSSTTKLRSSAEVTTTAAVERCWQAAAARRRTT
jgi:hypothetical protein